MTADLKREPILELVPGRPPKRNRLGAVELDRPATLRDLDFLPPTWRGEIIHGTLYAFPRPRGPHQFAETCTAADLFSPFGRGRGGPGGWIFLVEPGIKLPGAPEVSPDIAGWRRERLPKIPRRKAISIAPDWICEILSPSTRSYDRLVKRRYYADLGIPYLWYVAPLEKTLVASKLEAGRWAEIGFWGDDEKARIEPFEEIEIDLATWWEAVEEEESPDDGGEEISPEPPSSETRA